MNTKNRRHKYDYATCYLNPPTHQRVITVGFVENNLSSNCGAKWGQMSPSALF